jgi:hypothetical protein
MAKSLDEQVAEKEVEIEKLKAERDALKALNISKYPKHIQVPAPPPGPPVPTVTVTVNSEAEEKAALDTHKAPEAKEPVKGKH